MNKFFIIKLVIKNLMARKMRTILTIAGVAISIGFITFLVSFGLGLQRVSTAQITNLEALQILDVSAGKSNLVSITDEEVKKFNNLGNVLLVVPHFQVASKMEYEGSAIDGISYGKEEESLTLEDLKIVSGDKTFKDNTVLITTSALKQLGITNTTSALGKEINLTLVPKKEVLSEEQRDNENLKEGLKVFVGGVIDEENSAFIYMDIENFRENGFEKYDGVKIKTTSKDAIEGVKNKVESMGYKATSLKDTVDQINQFFYVFQVLMIVIGAIAVIVASLGMFNTLTINFLEKTREVGYMKVLGTTNRDIYDLFLGESLLIGISGGFFGILIAFSSGFLINSTIENLARSTGNQAVELFYMPWQFVIFIILTTMLVSLATGWWPSRRASKLNPLDALRYE